MFMWIFMHLFSSLPSPKKNVIGQHRKISQARWGHSDLIKDKLAVKLKSLDSPFFFTKYVDPTFSEKKDVPKQFNQDRCHHHFVGLQETMVLGSLQ